MSDQDTTTCRVCRTPLQTTPKLGDWIMHPSCREATRLYYTEGERAATQRIVAALRAEADAWAKVDDMAGGDSGYDLIAGVLRKMADASEKGEQIDYTGMTRLEQRETTP